MKTMKLLAVLAVYTILTIRANATTFYVDAGNLTPAAPYTNWPTAATNIQTAIDAATDGDTVLVTNGVYATGGRKWFDSGTNRVTVTNALIVRSINGPTFTVIQGYHGFGTNAVRCALLTTNAVLSGFMLTNGQSGVGNYPQGGGVYCYSSSAIISNCVLVGNVANDSGGGAFGGTLVNCVLKKNSAFEGGGASSASLHTCLLTGNSASAAGGGAYLSTLNNCTITTNTANGGCGVYQSTLNNCIVYYNYGGLGYDSCTLNYCCTTPLPASGIANFTNAPLFVDFAGGDYHLQSNSPCINAGKNDYVSTSTDFDGNPRIAGGTVDVGAYEFQTPASLLSYAWIVWAQQYGLSTNGAAYDVDSDGDGMNNWQEWIVGTNPTNAASCLQMLSATNSLPSTTKVTWQSVSGRTYYLQRSTNLAVQPAFSSIRSNIVGQANTTSFFDNTATNRGSYFYRVGVQ